MMLLVIIAGYVFAREIINMKKAVHIPLTVIAFLLGFASTLAHSAPLTGQVQGEELTALFPSTSMINHGKNVA